MTEEEIIEVAIQAGIKHRTDEFYSEFCDGVYFDDLVSFAKLVAEKEREECAKLCDGLTGRNYEFDMGRLFAGQTIRARGQE